MVTNTLASLWITNSSWDIDSILNKSSIFNSVSQGLRRVTPSADLNTLRPAFLIVEELVELFKVVDMSKSLSGKLSVRPSRVSTILLVMSFFLSVLDSRISLLLAES